MKDIAEVRVHQERHGNLYFQFQIAESKKEFLKYLAKEDEDVDPNTVAFCSQPDVSFSAGADREVHLIFKLIFNEEDFEESYLWHEVYHALSLYHKCLDAFGPFDEGINYTENNEEDVANVAGCLIEGARKLALPVLKKASK